MSLPLDEGTIKRIADRIQEKGRKHATGEPLFFDRVTLEQAIREALEQEGNGEAKKPPISAVDSRPERTRMITLDDD